MRNNDGKPMEMLKYLKQVVQLLGKQWQNIGIGLNLIRTSGKIMKQFGHLLKAKGKMLKQAGHRLKPILKS